MSPAWRFVIDLLFIESILKNKYKKNCQSVYAGRNIEWLQTGRRRVVIRQRFGIRRAVLFIMTEAQVRHILGKMFVLREDKKEGDDDAKCFRQEYMDENAPEYPIQQAVSNAMGDSELSFDFSYIIGEKAADILAEVDWDDDDAITEAIDSAIPVYTNELMQIYVADNWAVDEAVNEFGNDEDSSKNAMMAWYSQIRQMVEKIKNNLAEIIEYNGDGEENDE